MIDSATIRDMVVKILKESIQRFAIEDKGQEVSAHAVQIVIGTKDEESCEPYYWLIKNGKPHLRPRKNKDVPEGQEMTAEVTFNQILDVRMDVLARGIMARNFLSKAIARFADERQTDPRNIELRILIPVNYDEPVALLDDNSDEESETQFVRQLDWLKDIFVKDDEFAKELMGGQ